MVDRLGIPRIVDCSFYNMIESLWQFQKMSCVCQARVKIKLSSLLHFQQVQRFVSEKKNILGLGASLALKYNSNWAREYDSKVTFVKATQ